jgi:hypothetical protein
MVETLEPIPAKHPFLKDLSASRILRGIPEGE